MSLHNSQGTEEFVPPGMSQGEYIISLQNENKKLRGNCNKLRQECEILKHAMELKDKASKERLEQIQKSVTAQILEIDASQALANGYDYGSGRTGYYGLMSVQPHGERDQDLYSEINEYSMEPRNPTADTHPEPLSRSRSSSDGSIEEKTEYFVNSVGCDASAPTLPERKSDQKSNTKNSLTKAALSAPSLSDLDRPKPVSNTSGKKRHSLKLLRNSFKKR